VMNKAKFESIWRNISASNDRYLHILLDFKEETLPINISGVVAALRKDENIFKYIVDMKLSDGGKRSREVLAEYHTKLKRLGFLGPSLDLRLANMYIIDKPLIKEYIKAYKLYEPVYYAENIVRGGSSNYILRF